MITFFSTALRKAHPLPRISRGRLKRWILALPVAALTLCVAWADPVPPLQPFPLSAGQRGVVACLEDPAVQYDIFLPSGYSRSDDPLPIFYTCNPGGGGMVSDFYSVCSELQIITVGLMNVRNGSDWDAFYRDFHSVARDIRQRVLFDPSAEIVGGFSGGGVACYEFTHFRPQHVAGIYAMGGWMGLSPGKQEIEDWVPYKLLVARSTGSADSGAKYYLPHDETFLDHCGALVEDFDFAGGHELPPESYKAKALAWILENRTMPGPGDRAEALALATDWWNRIGTGGRQAVVYEATDILMSRPRSWFAHQAQVVLDELMADESFRTLEVAEIARGDFANDHFFYTARGAALSNDLDTYHAAMKVLTGITYVYGDRSTDIATMLQNYGFLPPVLHISHDGGLLNLSFTKDTPGLSYSLEASDNLPGTDWQKNLYPASETSTLWSAEVELQPDKPREFYRIQATVAAPATP